MKMLKSILLTSGAVLAFAASAQAADLPTKKGAAAPPAAIDCSGWNWWYNSAADCPLSAAGFTLYGQIDVGGGYETHAAKFNNAYPNGVQELISKQSQNGAWQGVPNGLSQSNVGVKWKEQFTQNWYFIGDVNFGFDPYSLQFANGPRSLEQNNNVAQINQSANGDSSRAYGLINARAYAGVQNPTFGTLTYGRQYAFSNDVANSLYDPYGGAYAFSLIGNSSTLGGGLGDTELARYTNSVKYVYSDHNIRVGAMSQVGGWSAGNNAQYAFEATAGFDWNGFSFDGVYEYARNAVALSAYGTAPPALPPNGAGVLKATIENESSFQLAAKYKWDKFTFFAGYENQRLTDPSSLPTGTVIGTFNGGYAAAYGTAPQGAIGSTADSFPTAKIINLFWTGAKYAVLPNVDLIGAYYYVHQNDYRGFTATTTGSTSCGAPSALTGAAAAAGFVAQGTASAKCAGNEYAVSGMVDWRPIKRLDVYAGAMYSKVDGGLASGYLVNNNLAVTGGLRLSF